MKMEKSNKIYLMRTFAYAVEEANYWPNLDYIARSWVLKYFFSVRNFEIQINCQIIARFCSKTCAISIVNTGPYENVTKSSDVFICTGEAGNPDATHKKPRDQKWLRGTLL